MKPQNPSPARPPAQKFSFREIGKALAQKPMLIALLMGFASGFPLLVASKTLQMWMAFTGGSNTTVGAMALIGIPYSLKFLWAPLMDRFNIGRLGRRRGWILITQVGLAISIFALSRLHPVEQTLLASFWALAISFFGASQDIVIDAYRRETLAENELGLGSAIASMGYRIAMWITGGAALILADHLSWNTVYALLAVVMATNLLVTFWAEEPPTPASAPKTLRDAVMLPLKDYFSRHHAWLILVFILLYKVGDSMAGNMLPSFYKHLNFTPTEIGAIAKTTAMFSIVAGTFVGGVLILRFGIYRSLFIFGILQAISTLSFVGLNWAGHSLPVFTGVVMFEDFSSGMGSAAFMAFMASLTNKNFTATQYALLTSLMAIPRTVISSVAGPIVDFLGWSSYFTFCAVLALPGLLLILWVYRAQRTPA